jgi:hypothetical protein
MSSKVLIEIRYRKRLAQSLVLLSAAYCFSFFAFFEIFGPPVRDAPHGWLGPTPRTVIPKDQIVDIGEVGFYTGTNTTLYRIYRPLCVTWLWLNGL